MPRNLHDAIARAVRTLTVLDFVPTIEDGRDLLQQLPDVVLLVRVPGERAAAELQALQRLRSEFRMSCWVGVFVEGDSDLTALARLGALGMTEIVSSERLQTADVLVDALALSAVAGTTARLWRRVHLAVDDALMTLLRPAVRLAHEPISLPRLAAATQMHERTLRKYCDLHRLPSPQWIAGWARLLVAAFYLEDHGRSVSSIAEMLGFSSPAEFANRLRRYTGHSASELRRLGPLDCVARRLEAHLGPPRGSTPPVPGGRGTHVERAVRIPVVTDSAAVGASRAADDRVERVQADGTDFTTLHPASCGARSAP